MFTRKYGMLLSISLLAGNLLQAYDTPPAPARLASWPSVVTYSSRKFYELLPQVYSDKVSVIEYSFSTSGYIYSLFGAVIPRKWWLFEPETTVNYLDPVDALALGAQCPSSEIIAEALRIMPTTKAMEKQTANYGQIKIDANQFLSLACNTVETKINRARLVKSLVGVLGSSIFMAKYTNLGHELAREPFIAHVADMSRRALPGEVTFNTGIANGATGATIAALGVTAYMANRLEQLYIADGVKCLELLITSDMLFVSNKTAVKKLLDQLSEKIIYFGFGSQYVVRLSKLASLLG